jgi:AraC-like DNA-binding protein
MTAMSPSVLTVLSTSSVGQHHRFGLWRESLRRMWGVHVLAERDVFDNGIIVIRALGDMRVSLVSADPHRVVRRVGHGTDENEGFICLFRVLAGRAELSQDGATTQLCLGEIALFDTTRPYTLSMPKAFSAVMMRFPHRVVGLDPSQTRDLMAVPWPCTTGVGAIVSGMLAELGNQLTELTGTAAKSLGNSISAMITSLLAERLEQSAAGGPGTARQRLLFRVQQFARDHLADSSLSPAMLAQQHNISLRYLQLLFAERGISPARWIRDERLARCYADLADPRCDHLTVAAICERWGLYGVPRLNRLFRKQYGLTPREFRKQRSLRSPRSEGHVLLHKAFGVESGPITTIHADTPDQNLRGGRHRDLRRAWATAPRTMPRPPGAAETIGLVLPKVGLSDRPR